MQSSNASDERRFDGHEKIENLTVTIHWTLGSRKGRNTDGRLRAGCRTSVLPEPLKSIRRKRCVALGAHNRPVAQVTLNGPRVLPVIGKLVAAGMARHVAVDQETEFCGQRFRQSKLGCWGRWVPVAYVGFKLSSSRYGDSARVQAHQLWL
jgi:hypothetical protein